MSEVQVRAAVAADATAVRHVADVTWHATYGGFMPAEVITKALNAWYDVTALAAQAEARRSVFLVAATGGGEMIGYLRGCWRQESGHAQLGAIYVLPAFQGTGAGARLLDGFVAALEAERPLEQLWVEVEHENAVGRRFYDRKGFVFVREYTDDLFGFQSKMVELSTTTPLPNRYQGGSP